MTKAQWQPRSLGDLVKFQRGHDLPSDARKPGNVPVVGSAGVSGYHNIARARAPGVTVGRSGASIGKAFFIGQDFWPHNAALFVKDFKGNNPRFIYYLLSQTDFSYLNTGAAQPSLNRNILHSLKILAPEPQEQQKIAAILTAYDDLIENNRQRIALLEKMAEEIYREWFVRLRFPGHEHTPVHKGVPEGWELRRLDSFGKVVTGKTPPTSNPRNYGGTIPFVKTPDMHGNTFVYETEETLTEDGLNSQPAQILPANALCVSCIGTGGVVSITTSRCSTNQQINSICLKDELDLEWMFFTLRSLKSTILAYGATGATMTNLSKGKFSGLKPPVPPADLRRQFHDLVEPKFTQSKLLVQANRHLTQTRDLLLNRLISGKLRVDDLDIQFPPSMQAETA